MKRVILAAVFIVAFSGFAAAQSTSAKQASKSNKAIVKKSLPAKSNSANTILKQETSASAKSDSTIKLVLMVPQISDTSALPPVKKNDEL